MWCNYTETSVYYKYGRNLKTILSGRIIILRTSQWIVQSNIIYRS